MASYDGDIIDVVRPDDDLPPFNDQGDLPEGVFPAQWGHIEQRFGQGSPERARALARLRLVHQLADGTGHMRRFLVFGSFVSSTPSPRDVDVALVMGPNFRVEEAPRESQTLFSHADAEARFGASVFWVREGMLSQEQMADFIETWQIKRDGRRRGLLEVIDDRQ